MTEYTAPVTNGETAEVVGSVAIDLSELRAALAQDAPTRANPTKNPRLGQEKGFGMFWYRPILDADLTAKEFQMMLFLSRNQDSRGRNIYKLDDLAQALSIRKTSAWRIIDSLARKDMIRRAGRADFYINPNAFWTGSLADRSVALLRWRNELDAKKDMRGISA
jgi:hypothetical protein